MTNLKKKAPQTPSFFFSLLKISTSHRKVPPSASRNSASLYNEMSDSIVQILGFVVLAIFVFYLLLRMIQVQFNVVEGLTSNTSSSGTPPTVAAQLKSAVEKGQDQLLVAKYKKDYEKIIVYTDDLIHLQMLREVCDIKESEVSKTISKLATLKQARDGLNSAMAFVDGQ